MRPMRSLLLCTAGDDDMAQSDRCERQAGYCLAQRRIARCKAGLQHTANALELCSDEACDNSRADT